MRKRRNKYSRRSAINTRRKKMLPVLLAVLGSLVLTCVIAVGLGAFLRYKADSYTPEIKYEYEGNYSLTPDPGYTVSAQIYNYGDYLYGMSTGKYDGVSVYLGSSDGVEFDSTVAASVSGVEVGERKLEGYTSSMHKYGLEACGYFYSNAFEIEDVNLRRLRKAYEISLLCEAAQKGIDDILILGITVSDENVAEVCEYIAAINKGAEDCAVGIALRTGLFLSTEEEDYTVRKIQSVSDYLAMDLRELSFDEVDEDSDVPQNLAQYLDTIKYYLDNETKFPYHARLVFSENNASFLDEAYKLGFKNVQAVNNLKLNQTQEQPEG